jgi:hypothetical protein
MTMFDFQARFNSLRGVRLAKRRSGLRGSTGISPAIVALFIAMLCAATAYGQFSGRTGGGRHGSKDTDRHSSSSDSKPASKPPPPPPPLTPHGGYYLTVGTNCYEIVYMPLQTRVYLFDSKLKPLSARDVHARMLLPGATESPPQPVSFQYAPLPAGATEQDYVMAQVDIRPLQDKEITITWEFSGLPDRRHPTASFNPHYPRFTIRPYVAKVLPTEADRNVITRQQICPVSGVPLGSRGPVVKLYIGDFPLYVAGDDCIAAVTENPGRFLP